MQQSSIAARRLRAKFGTSNLGDTTFPNGLLTSHPEDTVAAISLLHSREILVGKLKHEPLDLKRKQIRLLKVVSSAPARLQAQLEHFDADATPPYRALSYTWGHPTPTELIVINEQTCTVRSNLYQFLEIYGARQCDEYIWIDQLCIDQSNILERNHQVQLMAEIYRGASEVLIWLGSAGSKLKDLIENDYWQRMWIVQEVLLAKSLRVYHGQFVYEWAEVRAYFRENLDYTTPLQFWYLDKQVREGFDFATFNFVDAIRHCSKSKCQDPRDKVYALQGLLPETSRLRVDYSKDTATIFFEAAATLLCHSHAKPLTLFNGRKETVQTPKLYGKQTPVRTFKDVLDAIWHLSCEMGFRTIAEERGVNLGLNFRTLRPLIDKINMTGFKDNEDLYYPRQMKPANLSKVQSKDSRPERAIKSVDARDPYERLVAEIRGQFKEKL